MIRMLSRRQKKPDSQWRMLEQLFDQFNTQTTAVLSMNWHMVFERGIARAQSIRQIEYGCHASPVSFIKGKLSRRRFSGDTLHILKPHGSINWLYCDACRETFWVGPSDTDRVAQTLFRRRDWDVVLGGAKLKLPATLALAYPHCEAESLGTRFATFSYRKALDFPIHAASWRITEQYLKTTVDWVFIGYSMPAADFEFKHLLKRVQLTEKTRPNITVITGGRDADATIARFTKFFGDVVGKRFFLKGGLDKAAIAHLQKIQVLKS